MKIRRFPRLRSPETITRFRDIPLTTNVDSEATRWLVEGIFAERSINLLIAPPGGFKTWFGLALAKAISQHVDFLGHATRRANVLILDFENPLSAIRERQEILDLQEGKYLRIWGHWCKHHPPPLDEDRRLARIARWDHPLIIIDSLIRFHSANEDRADKMAMVMEGFRALTDAGATLLLLHHPPKSPTSDYRGSSDILAAVDAAFKLKEEKNGILKLECFKHRYIEEPTLNIRPDFADGGFEVVDDPSNSISAAAIEKIGAVIKSHPGIAQKDLLRKAELPETNGRRTLQQGEGVHWHSKRGRGKTLRYYPKSGS